MSSLPVSERHGGGLELIHLTTRTSERFRSRPIFFEPGCCFAARPSRFHTVHLWQRCHHGGHFDVDVFRHRGPRLPFLHHLLAVMIPLGHTRRPSHRPTRDVRLSCPASLASITDNGAGAFLCMLWYFASVNRGKSPISISCLWAVFWSRHVITLLEKLIKKIFLILRERNCWNDLKPAVVCFREESRGLAVVVPHWSSQSSGQGGQMERRWKPNSFCLHSCTLPSLPSPASLHRTRILLSWLFAFSVFSVLLKVVHAHVSL